MKKNQHIKTDKRHVYFFLLFKNTRSARNLAKSNLQAFYLLLGVLFRHELMIIWWEQAMLEVTLASYDLV
jgi:hypothetical protein